MRILLVLLMLCALFVVQSTLSKTPAFNPALRSESVLGDWRLVLNTSLYDPGEYEFQRGFGYIEAGSLFSDAVTADAETEALIDILSTRSDQALASLESAVTSDPAPTVPGLRLVRGLMALNRWVKPRSPSAIASLICW